MERGEFLSMGQGLSKGGPEAWGWWGRRAWDLEQGGLDITTNGNSLPVLQDIVPFGSAAQKRVNTKFFYILYIENNV